MANATTPVIQINEGNVGIGTASPGAKLDVQGTILVNNEIQFVDGNMRIFRSSNDMRFRTGGSDKMTILSGGNVGIGATGPTAKLHVLGGSNDTIDETTANFKVQGGGGNGTMFGTIASSPYTSYIQSAYVVDTSLAQYNLALNPIGGNVGIGTTSPYAFDTTATKLHVKNAGSSGSPSEVARFEGSSDADGSGGTIRLGTSNDRGIYFEGGRTGTVPYGKIGTTEYDGTKTLAIALDNIGNVGIGTTSPVQPLHVVGNAKVTGAYYDSNNSPGTLNQVLRSTETGTDWVDGSGSSIIGGPYLPLSAGTSFPLTGDLIANTQIFAKGGANITTSGGGTINVYTKTVSTNLFSALRIIENTGASSYWDIGATGGSSTSLNFYHNANTTPKIFFTHTGGATFTGNVGIGATSPGAKLEVGANVAKGVLINRTFTTSSQTLANVRAYYGLAITPLRTGTGGLYFTNYDADTPIIQSVNTSDVAQFLLLNPFGGNVGIGTTSPDGNLEVITSTIVSGASDTVNNVLIGLQAANRPTIILDTADTTYTNRTWNITNVGSAGKLFIGRNGLDVMVMDNSGNVGIGTTSPNQSAAASSSTVVSTKAKTSGGVAITELIGLANNDNDKAGLISFISQNATSALASIRGLRYTSDTTGKLAFFTSGTEKMRIDYNGNVGIGTTAPDSILHVNGYRLRLGDGASDSKLWGTPASGGNFLIGQSSNTGRIKFVSSADSDLVTILNGGNVGIGTSSPATQLHVESDNPIITLQRNNNGNASGALQFRGSDNVVDWQMGTNQVVGLGLEFNFQNSNKVYIETGGNVGIGTTTPGNKLHVVEGTSTWEAVEIQSSSTTGCGVTLVGANTSVQWSMIANASNGGAGANNLGFHLTNAGSSGGSNGYKMTIQASSGNVGIGTTSPDSRLTVSSGTSNNVANFKSTDGTAYIAIADNSSSGALVNQIGVVGDDMYFATADVERMRITSAGELQVTGNGVIKNEHSSANFSYWQQTASDARLFTQYAQPLYFGTNASTKMTILSGGNVGIGTTSPTAKLHLAVSSANDDTFNIFNGSVRTHLLASESTNGVIYMRSSANSNKVRINTSGDSYFNGGNVGIGTTSPGSKLQVAGEIRAADGNKGTPSYTFTSDTNTGMYSDTADVIDFTAGGTKSLSVTTSGATVYGSALMPSNAAILLQNQNNNNQFYIRNSGVSDATFQVGQGAPGSNVRFFINGSGNVGIGNTASTASVKLEVTGNTLLKNSNGVGDLYLGNYATANHFRFHTNNSNTYFDMNCGDIYWRQGASTRYQFFASTANMTIQGTLTQNSDARTKENVIEISDCISKVKAMRGVYYNRTDFNTEVTKVGVIAQEVEAVLPELVLESPETGLKSVAYSELTSVLINAIKEQQEIIEDLKTRITKLEN